MKVIFYEDKVRNFEDDQDPVLIKMVEDGAEEIPIDIFNGYPNYANTQNTRKSGGVWVFDLNVEAQVTEQLAANVRLERDLLLTSCDWTQNADAPLTDSQMEEWRVYRQALRDITRQVGFPQNVTWPAQPVGPSTDFEKSLVAIQAKYRLIFDDIKRQMVGVILADGASEPANTAELQTKWNNTSDAQSAEIAALLGV